MKKFTYRVVTVIGVEHALEAHGQLGWELVSVVPSPGGTTLYFKRERR